MLSLILHIFFSPAKRRRLAALRSAQHGHPQQQPPAAAAEAGGGDDAVLRPVLASQPLLVHHQRDERVSFERGHQEVFLGQPVLVGGRGGEHGVQQYGSFFVIDAQQRRFGHG